MDGAFVRRRHAGRFLAAVCLAAGLLVAGGCSHEQAGGVALLGPVAPEPELLIRGDQPWSETGIFVHAGEALTIQAAGAVTYRAAQHLEKHDPAVGPEGTYLFEDEVAAEPFPLPAAALGPAACYGLIGRIGDGPPFYIGACKSWIVECDGPLRLGINDFDPADNTGAFRVRISKPGLLHPVRLQETVGPECPHGGPLPGCSVVVFYVDGLRPDVVREMAAMGHIPNINRLFIEGGAWPSQTFTAFPSDTITSNGTMWTGCFSDRHGIKGQVRFSRRTLDSQSYLEPLGPSRSARLLAPQGIDKATHAAQAAGLWLLQGAEAADRWDATSCTGVPPLFQHLRDHGKDWATGALPMMTDLPPLLWSRSLVKKMPYFKAHQAWQYIDDANAHYAQWQLLPTEPAVTIIWLPETDSVSHKYSRGQFGVTRRTIARADEMIGRIADQLQAAGRLQRTYFLLVSDHGHHGGQWSHLSHFDIADEVFFRPRELSPDGAWIGGGLGLSVRQHRFWNRHPEDKAVDFAFIDGDSDGAARIFLPRCHFHSGDWLGPPRPGNLLQYRIADHLPPVNLVQALLAQQAIHSSTGCVDRPIDLVLMKLDDCSILISTADRGQAVIDRRRGPCGEWFYRYTPVMNVAPTPDGLAVFERVPCPACDPLGLAQHLPPGALLEFYDERSWLRMTADTCYPDAVVALTRHMLWQDHLACREREFAPDLVVTARPGWYFGVECTKGTTHGYPLADAMRATLFITGPNIRRGACLTEPARLADLTPTILEMTGTPYNPAELDGRALRDIYQPCIAVASPCADQSLGLPPCQVCPVYWHDLDLHAWSPLPYCAGERSDYVPWSINRPYSAWDLNSIAYNALTISDLSVLRIMDDVLFPLCRDERAVSRIVEGADQRLRCNGPAWVGPAMLAVDVTNTTVADYQLQSMGNIMRLSRGLDWAQAQMQQLDGRLVGTVGLKHTPGAPLLHGTVDRTQNILWDGYRWVQRAAMWLGDETLINSVENCTDRAVNSRRKIPADIYVLPPGRARLTVEEIPPPEPAPAPQPLPSAP